VVKFVEMRAEVVEAAIASERNFGMSMMIFGRWWSIGGMRSTVCEIFLSAHEAAQTRW